MRRPSVGVEFEVGIRGGNDAGSALASVVVCAFALIIVGSSVAVGQTSAPGTARSAASPDPMAVGVEFAPDVTTTSLVTTDKGGYLSLFAPDGTMYALTIPPKAVLSDLDMTMTLVTSVTGSPLGEELVGAVDIGPSGLELLQPAMLTITPLEPLPVAQDGPFTSRTDGSAFHMTPLITDPSTLTIPILHLTVFGRSGPTTSAGRTRSADRDATSRRSLRRNDARAPEGSRGGRHLGPQPRDRRLRPTATRSWCP